MDLSDFKPKSDTVTVELTTPDGEPLLNKDGSPMTITAYSSFSKAYRAVQDEITDKRMEATYREASKSKKKRAAQDAMPTMAELRRAAVELAVKTTVSWNITMGGTTPEFTEDNVRELYTDLAFIYDQVQEKVNDYSAHLGN